MILEEASQLEGYELIDSGDGYRLERYGDYVLARPDPGALWKKSSPLLWEKASAVFSDSGWKIKTKMPEKWLMHYRDISFYAKLSAFKHTGIFPEQKTNWDFIVEHSKGQKGGKFLNLFGYTGIASVLAGKLGWQVTHVDASKPSISWARENMLASGLPETAIRWIYDDCLKFVKREARRDAKYDAILLDPPAFGRGPKGEVWKFGDGLSPLLTAVGAICSENVKFIIINTYAVSVSSILLGNMLHQMKPKRKVEYGELVLQEKSGRLLSTGIFGRLY